MQSRLKLSIRPRIDRKDGDKVFYDIMYVKIDTVNEWRAQKADKIKTKQKHQQQQNSCGFFFSFFSSQSSDNRD